MTEPVYIVSAVRTPIGKFGGSFKDLTPADLSLPAAVAAIERAGLQPEHVDETLWGHARQAGGGPNTARQVGVRAGVPVTSPAATLNKACASGLMTIVDAWRHIQLGDAEVVLAGGVEVMSRTPYLLMDARWGHRMGHGRVVDGMYQDGFHCPLADQLMGGTAETLAAQYAIDRAEQDRWAVHSQACAARAWEAGAFDAEIVPVTVQQRRKEIVVGRDEHMRPGTTVEKLARLKPVFAADGSVHAGNSSGVTDGAAALVVASARAVERHGLTPLARIHGYAFAGVDPKVMGIGPVPAVRKLEQRTGWTLGSYDLVELNEAFAVQLLACSRDLPELDLDKVNVNGGSIALGHPIGATGARITVTLLHALKARGGKRGLATLCVSGGMGAALAVEMV